MTLTMVGYSFLTHSMVAIGIVVVGKILGRSREVFAAFVLIAIFEMFGTLVCLCWTFDLMRYRKSLQLSIFFQFKWLHSTSWSGRWVYKDRMSAVTSVLKNNRSSHPSAGSYFCCNRLGVSTFSRLAYTVVGRSYNPRNNWYHWSPTIQLKEISVELRCVDYLST